MQKSLDQKLAAIHADPSGAKAFILADAKDQDMAFGMAAPGSYHSHEAPRAFPYRSREEFLAQIRGVITQGMVDIVLLSVSNSERLVLEEKLFEKSHVTPAIRANDTTDIWSAVGGTYPRVPSRPFRSATLEHAQCGRVQCTDEERKAGPDLGLYSITFMNDRDRDHESLEAYKRFRSEAESVGFRHFMEVFDPNISGAIEPAHLGRFINDNIARTLAAVPRAGRPIFLKTVYHGPRHMEELVHYDPHLIVGILGGAAGTTFDAFDLLYQARKYGARAALFGRKINQAEHQTAFIKFLRLIADGELLPGEAVRAYHGVLQTLGIKPVRPLEDDVKATVDLMAGDEASRASVVMPDRGESSGAPAASPFSYGASVATLAPAPGSAPAAASPARTAAPEAEPDFDRMTPAEKLDYNQRRRDSIFG